MSASEPQFEKPASPPQLAMKEGVCGKAWTFLTSTQTPRWHTYATAIFAVLVSVMISSYSDNKKRNDDYRVQQFRALSDSMMQFQVHAASFAFQVSETKHATSNSKKILIENLNDQYAKINLVEKLLPQSDAITVENYRNAIMHMEEVVNGTNDILEMGPFWTAASRLLVSRNQLNEALRRSI